MSIREPLETVLLEARSRAAEIESGGRLPADLIDRLAATEVFRLWLPKHLHGYEAHVLEVLEAIEQASYHDGATGWCVMIGCTTSLNAAFLPPAHATAIFGDPKAIAGGFGMPAGVARIVEGGLRVTGEWAWGSGSSHATCMGGGVRIVDTDGQPAALADGGRTAFVFFDRDDVELLDTWHVMGMKGTASTDYRVQEAFVPEGRWVSFGTGGEPTSDSPLYRFSFFGALALGVASVTIGLARRAIDELIALGAKQPFGSSRSLAERGSTQAELATAEAGVLAAKALIRDVVESGWDTAEREGAMTGEQKRQLRLAANHAATASVRAVDICHAAAGGTAVYETSPLQRVFRDVHVAKQHGMIAPRLMEPLGRMAFGLPTSTAQF